MVGTVGLVERVAEAPAPEVDHAQLRHLVERRRRQGGDPHDCEGLFLLDDPAELAPQARVVGRHRVALPVDQLHLVLAPVQLVVLVDELGDRGQHRLHLLGGRVGALRREQCVHRGAEVGPVLDHLDGVLGDALVGGPAVVARELGHAGRCVGELRRVELAAAHAMAGVAGRLGAGPPAGAGRATAGAAAASSLGAAGASRPGDGHRHAVVEDGGLAGQRRVGRLAPRHADPRRRPRGAGGLEALLGRLGRHEGDDQRLHRDDRGEREVTAGDGRSVHCVMPSAGSYGEGRRG